MAQDTYACLAGSKVALHGPDGVFRVCPYCAGQTGKVSDGVGPHVASLKCNQCERHLSWLSRDHLAAMLSQSRGAA